MCMSIKVLQKLQHFKICPTEELSSVLNILSSINCSVLKTCLSTDTFEKFTKFSVDDKNSNKVHKHRHYTLFERN